jgi:hypothetical protein
MVFLFYSVASVWRTDHTDRRKSLLLHLPPQKDGPVVPEVPVTFDFVSSHYLADLFQFFN